MVSAKVNFEIFLAKNASLDSASLDSCSLSTKRKLKLPKIELVKFSSELKDWLSFWSQFKRIHEDKELENEDKFQYLIQCISKGTRAREIIDCFPPTSENYNKAIESLKSRFGRDELLIEFYVRQLLQLVVQNAKGAKIKINISSLYDKLESYLRALESIGLTSDKYAAMLFPLVESCIPEDIFRVWLRNPGATTDGSSDNVYSTKLKSLLAFLKTEVEGDERIRLAQSSFENDRNRLAQSSFENEHRQRKEKSPQFTTANDLFSGTLEKKKINHPCVFCDKMHDSKECFHAQELNWEQKQEILRNKKCCFLCLKVGHRSKFCKTRVKCVLCSKKHLVLMCPELPANKITEKISDLTSPQVSLTNHCTTEDVLLQTLIVKLKSRGKTRQVRVLIDSGSQRSYILESTAKTLDLDPIEKKSYIHALFGGFNTQEKHHKLFKVNLEALSGKFSCDIEVLDHPKICSKIPRLKQGFWNKELQERKIWITDYGENCPDIEILIGADFCGQLLTGRMHKLKCGLIACETYLGWIVMGKVPGEIFDHTSTNLISSLFVKNASIANLRKMDILGIKDPVETKSREEMETAAVDHFSKTFSINEDVALDYTDEDYQTLTNHELFSQHIRPIIAKADPKIAISKMVTLISAKGREFLENNPNREAILDEEDRIVVPKPKPKEELEKEPKPKKSKGRKSVPMLKIKLSTSGKRKKQSSEEDESYSDKCDADFEAALEEAQNISPPLAKKKSKTKKTRKKKKTKTNLSTLDYLNAVRLAQPLITCILDYFVYLIQLYINML